MASGNTVDVAIYLYRTRNVRIANIQMNYVPNGIAALNSDNVSVQNLYIKSVVGNNAAPAGIRMETQNRGVSLENIFITS